MLFILWIRSHRFDFLFLLFFSTCFICSLSWMDLIFFFVFSLSVLIQVFRIFRGFIIILILYFLFIFGLSRIFRGLRNLIIILLFSFWFSFGSSRIFRVLWFLILVVFVLSSVGFIWFLANSIIWLFGLLSISLFPLLFRFLILLCSLWSVILFKLLKLRKVGGSNKSQVLSKKIIFCGLVVKFLWNSHCVSKALLNFVFAFKVYANRLVWTQSSFYVFKLTFQKLFSSQSCVIIDSF